MGFFRRLFSKSSRTEGFIFAQGVQGAVYPEYDYEKIAREAYQQNLIAYRCIYMIAQAVGSIAWEVWKDNGAADDTELESGPYVDLLRRPNPRQGWPALLADTVSYYLLTGNAYIEKVSPLTGRNTEPRELYTHRPDKMKVLTGRAGIIGYQYGYGQGSVTFDVDPLTGRSPILHLRTFNPLDYFYGWAPTMSVAGHIDNSNDALSWNRAMFKNGARPGTLIMMERSLSPEQYTRYKEQLKDKFSGASNAGKTMIFDNLGEGKVNVQPFGWNPREMDYLNSSREDARRIAYAYGVPPQLIGIPGDNTYSNMKEARLAFWEETVMPLLQYLAGELNNWLFADNKAGLYLKYDLTAVPALSVRRTEAWERAEQSTTLTINEKRELQGYAPIPGGDVVLVNGAQIPFLGSDAPEAEDSLTEDVVEEEEDAARAVLEAQGFSAAEIDTMLGYTDE